MANSINLTNQKFYTIAQVEQYFGSKAVGFGLASDWTSIDVPHVLVTMVKCGIEEIWAVVLESPIGNDVPSNVASTVQRAIYNISAKNTSLDQTKYLDVKFCGEGRYESDWFRNHGSSFGQYMYTIETFLKHAYKNGIDGAAWLIDNGYQNPQTISAIAKEWP